jgi:TonB-dependent receptor
MISVKLRGCAHRAGLILSVTVVLFESAGIVHAQTTAPGTRPASSSSSSQEDQGTLSEVVVTGIRASQRTSIETKRTATTIVDAISAEQIGVLPDNSIAETLERVVGVTGDRFKGSASELSIRGLGPFLGFATINGRDISTGGGNRSVSFQQFPSELTKGVLVYKAQQADLVEGGVAGTIDLLTGTPLDYSGRHFDVSVKGQFDPYAHKFNDESGFGGRGSASYSDRFDTGIGDFGVLAGFFHSKNRVPEDFYTTSSSWRPCNTLQNSPATSSANCAFAAAPSATTTLAPTPYYISNTYNYRELATDEERNAFMSTVEWRLDESFRMLADVEISSRDDLEGWHDLVLSDGRRGIGNAVVGADGVLDSYSGNSRVGAQTRLRDRYERYSGGGFAADWTPNSWKVHGDLSESRSHRTQADRSAALSTRAFVPYSIQAAGFDIPQLTFTNFDPNDFTKFNSNTSANYSSNTTDFVDDIKAAKIDVEHPLELLLLRSIKGGVRWSKREHESVNAAGASNPITDQALVSTAVNNCHVPFEESRWGADSKGGGVPSTWATFDPGCLYSTFAGTSAAAPAIGRDPSNVNVTERTLAGYLMASFGSRTARLPFAGNLGVRVVRTRETVRGFSSALHATTAPDGFIQLTADQVNLTPVSAGNSFTDVLPSLNLAFDVREDFKIRGAVYKAIARPNMEEMRSGRTFTAQSGEAVSVPAALASASGGNPALEPLRSWNYDLSFEWYPDPYTLVSVAPYYKELKAAFTVSTNNTNPETVLVDGVGYTVNVAQLANSPQKSWLRGFEINAQHSFRELPGLLQGLGTQLSYSHAQSNYNFPDPSAVDPAHPLDLFTNPAGIVGLSRYIYNATVYWSNERLEVRTAYRYRSLYFKPVEPTGSAANRYVDNGGFLDASIRYNIIRNTDVMAQVTNITNQPQVMFRPVEGQVAQTEYSGRTYYLGAHFHY